jgi:hypothetical protein
VKTFNSLYEIPVFSINRPFLSKLLRMLSILFMRFGEFNMKIYVCDICKKLSILFMRFKEFIVDVKILDDVIFQFSL